MLVRVFLESGAFPLGFGGPFRTGRVASSAELHGPRELSARLPAPFEVLTGLKEEPSDAGKACTACMTHLPATSRKCAEPWCILTLRARATMSSLPGRSFGVAKPPRRPRSLTLRAGKKSYQLALNVSSRRAADRSPTEQDGRRAESIGINSNMIRDNTQAVGTTPGRLIWLGFYGLTVGVAKRPDCLHSGQRPVRPTRRSHEGRVVMQVTAKTRV